MKGHVKWFDSDRGYGFIVNDDLGPDIFVHYKAIAVKGYRSLCENQRVIFDVIDTDNGPQAQNVKPL